MQEATGHYQGSRISWTHGQQLKAENKLHLRKAVVNIQIAESMEAAMVSANTAAEAMYNAIDLSETGALRATTADSQLLYA